MKSLTGLLVILAVATQAHRTGAGDKVARPLDNDFLVKAASCNNAEIEVSKLADRRSSSANIKAFATTLSKDHKAALEKTGELLKTRKIGVVAGLEKESRDEVTRLGKLEGNEFDRAFLDHLIREHQKAIAIFENQVKNGQQADIRSYASELLPELRKHLARAEELRNATGK